MKFITVQNSWLLPALLFTSCVNLKQVQDYAGGSLENIRKFENIPYSFHQACLDLCRLERISRLTLKPGNCDCAPSQTADSVTLVIYQACRNYFDALDKLSRNELTKYRTNNLAQTIDERYLDHHTKDKTEVTGAYAALSNLLLRSVADGYRKNKIKQVITDANAPLQQLLGYLKMILNNSLSGRLDIQLEMLENGIYPDLFKKAVSDFEKKQVIDEYDRSIEQVQTHKKQIALYARALTHIANGHQQLYDHRNQLSAPDLREQLFQLVTDTENAISEFNKITHSNP